MEHYDSRAASDGYYCGHPDGIAGAARMQSQWLSLIIGYGLLAAGPAIQFRTAFIESF